MDNKTIIRLILILLVILPSVYAIGISPSSKEIWYEPGKEITFDFYIRIKEHESKEVIIYTTGELNDSIILEKESATLKPGIWTRFKAKIILPEQIDKPGLYDTRIGVVEKFKEEGGTIGVLAGVESRILIRVPYPGRFLELKNFGISVGEVNKPITFSIDITNRGKEKINEAIGILDIKNNQGEIIATLRTNKESLKFQERKIISSKWQTSKPGIYSVEGKVIYDNNLLKIGKENFKVGDLNIEIKNISVSPTKIGEITKINAELKSVWNNKIKDIYGEATIKNNQGNIVGKAQGPSIDLQPWETKTITIYWDSQNMPAGKYKGDLKVYYEEKSSEKSFNIEINDPSITNWLKENLFITVIILLSILMITFSIIFFLKKRTKKKKKKKNG